MHTHTCFLFSNVLSQVEAVIGFYRLSYQGSLSHWFLSRGWTLKYLQVSEEEERRQTKCSWIWRWWTGQGEKELGGEGLIPEAWGGSAKSPTGCWFVWVVQHCPGSQCGCFPILSLLSTHVILEDCETVFLVSGKLNILVWIFEESKKRKELNSCWMKQEYLHISSAHLCYWDLDPLYFLALGSSSWSSTWYWSLFETEFSWFITFFSLYCN